MHFGCRRDAATLAHAAAAFQDQRPLRLPCVGCEIIDIAFRQPSAFGVLLSRKSQEQSSTFNAASCGIAGDKFLALPRQAFDPSPVFLRSRGSNSLTTVRATITDLNSPVCYSNATRRCLRMRACSSVECEDRSAVFRRVFDRQHFARIGVFDELSGWEVEIGHSAIVAHKGNTRKRCSSALPQKEAVSPHGTTGTGQLAEARSKALAAVFVFQTSTRVAT